MSWEKMEQTPGLGGIWHQGGNAVSWASYYLAGFILQPKCFWYHGDLLKTLILNLEQLKSEGPGAGAVLMPRARCSVHR